MDIDGGAEWGNVVDGVVVARQGSESKIESDSGPLLQEIVWS